MVKLYKFNGAWGMPDISPFCIKVETYLRLVGVPFECVVSDARKGPKQKLPYIDPLRDGRGLGNQAEPAGPRKASGATAHGDVGIGPPTSVHDARLRAPFRDTLS